MLSARSTQEDFNYLENANDGILMVRNRMTDKLYQQAKRTMKIKSKRSYSTREYRTEKVGFEIVHFSRHTYEMILQYESIAHQRALRKHKKNYKNAEADSVTPRCGKNHYMFLNRNGDRLSVSGWNKYIKKVYEGCGLELDSEFKSRGLNHRMRHGFATRLARMKIEGKVVDMETIKRLGRWRSTDMMLRYTNPSEEDVIRMRQELEDMILTEKEAVENITE